MKERNMVVSKNIISFLAMLSIAFQAYSATTYPEKPIKIVIGFPAGGPLDQNARLLTDKLQIILGQPVIVDYKPGAGCSVGAESVAKSPAGTPKDVVAKLSDAFKQIMNNPDVRSRMVTQGADPAFMGSDEFGQFIALQTPLWAKAVATSGAKLD